MCEPFYRINLPSDVLQELKFDGKVGASTVRGLARGKAGSSHTASMMTTSRKMANLQLSAIARRYVETTSRLFYYYASPSINIDGDNCTYSNTNNITTTDSVGSIASGTLPKNVTGQGAQGGGGAILPTMT